MIIIPDIHGRIFWKKPVEENLGKEYILFLGDYLDPYYYEDVPPEEVFPRFMEILALKQEHPDDIMLLLGNHDLHYVNGALQGGRYDYLHGVRNKKAFSDNARLFQLTYEIVIHGQRYLFSHAGIHAGWIQKYKAYLGGAEPEEIGRTLNEYWWNNGHWPRLFTILKDIPYSRFGNCRYGSPVWADIKDWQDDPEELPGIYQIFGHSQQETDPVIGRHFASLDCRKAFRLTNDGIIIDYGDI